MDHEVYLWLVNIEAKIDYLYNALKEKGIISEEQEPDQDMARKGMKQSEGGIKHGNKHHT